MTGSYIQSAAAVGRYKILICQNNKVIRELVRVVRSRREMLGEVLSDFMNGVDKTIGCLAISDQSGHLIDNFLQALEPPPWHSSPA